jgi:hypothetical protein
LSYIEIIPDTPEEYLKQQGYKVELLKSGGKKFIYVEDNKGKPVSEQVIVNILEQAFPDKKFKKNSKKRKKNKKPRINKNKLWRNVPDEEKIKIFEKERKHYEKVAQMVSRMMLSKKGLNKKAQKMSLHLGKRIIQNYEDKTKIKNKIKEKQNVSNGDQGQL